MLNAPPEKLRVLLGKYESLKTRRTGQETAETRRQLRDVTYTLCVSTGTRTIEAALTAARGQVSGTPGTPGTPDA
jgi:hypothetical protein